jgi:cupin fold WbuC family metalloprotein
MIPLEKINEEVFIAQEPIVRVGLEEVEFLKQQARSSPKGRARICAHTDTLDPLHQMIIALFRDGYVRPHKHLNKAESFHVVDGEGVVVVFKEDGEIFEVIPVAVPGRCRQFFYRLPAGYYHTILVESEVLVVHEATSGPFNREHTVEAPFSPESGCSGDVLEYSAELKRRVAGFLKTSSRSVSRRE